MKRDTKNPTSFPERFRLLHGEKKVCSVTFCLYLRTLSEDAWSAVMELASVDERS
jgi:hypothetical protein